MALPPEHLHIKRRREEDPVETLYIQSDSVQHSKRRFTDFVFQRVVRERDKTVIAASSRGGDGVDNSAVEQSLASAAPAPGGQRAVSAGVPAAAGRHPVTSGPAGGGGGGQIPTVRATAPGDEFARGKRAVGPREGDDVTRKTEGGASSAEKMERKTKNGAVASPKAMAGMRRFHLAAPAGGEGLTSASVGQGSKSSRKARGGGRGGRVQKRKTGKPSARAVVVEKAQVHAVSGGEGAAAASKERAATAAAALEDVTSMIGSVRVSGGASKTVDLPAAETGPSSGPEASPPRKRHVVNEAERRWRAEEKASKYSDRMLHDRDVANRIKTGRSAADDPSTWNQDSEQLADELSRIAMQMTGDAPSATTTAADSEAPGAAAVAAGSSSPPKPASSRSATSSPSKSPLKYPPRLPKQLRARRPSRGGSRGGMHFDGGSDEMDVDPTPPQKAAPTDVANISATDTDDPDSGYIYDEFIRRPVADILSDPRLAQLYGNDSLLGVGEDVKALPRDIGVVVITSEDAHYWDELAEDDEQDSFWDTEDEDSNAEDNPAHEYPDEDLDFDDEFDDTNAAYRLYRQNASDDEEFDVDEYDEQPYPVYTTEDSDDMGASV